jgi:hypothetical protein
MFWAAFTVLYFSAQSKTSMKGNEHLKLFIFTDIVKVCLWKPRDKGYTADKESWVTLIDLALTIRAAPSRSCQSLTFRMPVVCSNDKDFGDVFKSTI